MSQGPIPPGWYEPPAKPGLLAYWDGEDWDASIPPQPVTKARELGATNVRSNDGLKTAGWLCAFLIPIAGFVIGLIYISRGDKDGWWMTGASVVMSVVGWMYLTDSLPAYMES